MPDQCGTTTLTQAVTTACGVFAPGHLGALTRYLPFELVDDVLDRPGRRGRTRTVPARAAVYFVLALALFPGASYSRVWDTLAGALRQAGHLVASVTAAGLGCVRRRVGPDPLRELFEVVAGPLGRPCTTGVSYRGLRTVAFDGCRSTRVPETGDNVAWLGRYKVAAGVAAYPLLAVMALAETGTRALLGAVVGPYRGEVEAALQLVGHLRQDMLVLADRGFDANAFIRAVHASRAALLLRICSSRRPAVLRILADGSFLSVIAGVPVRVITATVTVTCADGSTHRGEYRLVTTLTDVRRHPAEDLLTLYHQRWEIEVAFLAIRHTMLKGRVLRSGDPQGLRQEMWALPTVHQLLRMAMLDATDAVPGCDPDRACFTAALAAARDSVTRAAAILPADGSELQGPITEAIVGALLPPRRARISARTVKGVSARYGHRRSDEDRPAISTPVTAIDIIVHSPQQDTSLPAPTAAPPGRIPAPPPQAPPAPDTGEHPPVTAQTLLPPAAPMHTSRLEDVLAAMSTAPEREWRAFELATLLRLDRSDLTGELIRWAKRQILIKTGPATFKIPDGPLRPSKVAVRREDVLAVMATDPHRPWHAREITAALSTVKQSTLALHLSAWARKNLPVKTAPATYRLPEQPVTAARAKPLSATNTPTSRST